ncbi:energy transducer TonB [Vibrio algarum]|uniref:Protein TonB n=1 Tax=Vibrio algarum TaxID=3020714 RepID=A0ABT4YVV6_9VIBR|nr:energy transducer TonB [Vibrio sp. KJ40-1]MDB1125712.1 energy transducer TonB [Vibrio sp. KJ40-1]
MIRLLMALPLAVLLSYSLVGMMAWMVDLNTKETKSEHEALRFNFFMTETEQASQRKSRDLPKPPEMKPLPPEQTFSAITRKQPLDTPTLEPVTEMDVELSVAPVKFAAIAPTLPSVAYDKASIAQQTQPIQLGKTQQVMPLHRKEPDYPKKALQRKIEGYVVVSFDIDRSGKPENIIIEESYPSRVFNREALRALKKWKYQPMLVNGLAQTRYGQRVKLEFKIQ